MPKKGIWAVDVQQAVEVIARSYREDTSDTAPMGTVCCFDGWYGLAASAVLRAIVQEPPASLKERFDKIIHIDCSIWKSRRALQRAIAEELKLPRRFTHLLDEQDEEDDFSGLPQGSRAEMMAVSKEIHKALLQHRCLVVFHNGSCTTVDLTDLGIPSPRMLDINILYTFRGRLRLNEEIEQKVDGSHLYIKNSGLPLQDQLHGLVREEGKEIAWYTGKTGVTPKIAAECCSYLLYLNRKGGNIMDYNWVIHAYSYWVCDGIIQAAGHENSEQEWDVAAAIHQQLHLEDYSFNTLPTFGYYEPDTSPSNRWVFVTNSTTVSPETTSFFLATQDERRPPLVLLPDDMFHQSDKLGVLKLQRCTFNFASPPFNSCRNLRFLGLHNCKDQGHEEKKNQENPPMEFFRSLWVLDICNMDWELTLSQEIMERMATNMREIHIKHGRICGNNLAWHRLQNLRKVRIIDPTYPLEIDDTDGFTYMRKLVLLDLSRNSSMLVLPSLSGATNLLTLVLDGFVGLQHVGPVGLPTSLESFYFNGGSTEDQDEGTKISRISIVSCPRLVNFELCGSLPNLEELDLSGTSIKTFDLRDEVLQVTHLRKIILLGCEQLRSILWPENGIPKLRMLFIDTRGGGNVTRQSLDLARVQQGPEHCHASVATTDIRFIQSLTLKGNKFCWRTYRYNLYICISRTYNDRAQMCSKDRTGPGNTRQIIVLPQRRPAIPNPCCYADVPVGKIIGDDTSGSSQFELLDNHLDIGEGISYAKNMERAQCLNAIRHVMDTVNSLHVHDNSSISNVTFDPKGMESTPRRAPRWIYLKHCRVERCPKLHTVITTNYDLNCFARLETFWGAELSMAHCIWSRGSIDPYREGYCFEKLRSIHLHFCPRLTFVLPLSWIPRDGLYFPNLETLHIIYCGDLNHVFPVDPKFMGHIPYDRRTEKFLKDGIKFPKLKHIYLQELQSLQQICELKIVAPMLETIKVKGCWSLRRLPAVGDNRRVVSVDCEQDWWEKLEWDGLKANHHPSLFQLRASRHYKQPLPRGSLLR